MVPLSRDFPSIADAVVQLKSFGSPAETRRICWVTDEFVNLFKNGGGGTVVAGFCEALLAAGHKVSVLYTSPLDRTSPENARTIADLHARGMEFTFLVDIWKTDNGLTARSHAIHDWLKEREFDIVHFHDFNGSGFAACSAKRMGLAYEKTLLCVSNFGSSRWAWECMEQFIQTPFELERDWIERRSLENADVVLCQSQYMAGWLRSNGYNLPATTYVQPSIIPFNLEQDGPCGKTTTPVREIVFFARQEVRKGLRVFVAAAAKLAKHHPELRFTFSGKFSEIDYEHSGGYILAHLETISNDISFLAHLTRDQALRHLKGADVLAVMPSIDDNFPGAVIEAVHERIEFIASNRGGIPEIVHPENHTDRLFEPTPEKLAAAVEHILAVRPPAPKLAFDPDANIEAWTDWHARVALQAPAEKPLPDPLVSVCVVHYNRPHFLVMVIEGLSQQTYTNFEVVLVDDGSTDAAALRYVEELETKTLPFSLKVVRTPDIRLGAARNAGAKAASGEFLIFVDDDNVPRSIMVESLLRAAQRRNLDIATCWAYVLSGNGKPVEDGMQFTGYHPAGGPSSQGLVDNVYGDANALVRRDVFIKLDGFDPAPGIGAEDWEFFARAVLSGHKLEVVPEALYWYRQHEAQLTLRWHSTHLYYERLLQTYWRMLGEYREPEMENALRVYMGQFSDKKLKTSSWYHLGLRNQGELQRHLLPQIGNTQESYRILSLICIEMTRYRDAARLIILNGNPHGHLLELGRKINEVYQSGRTSFAQGYYGENLDSVKSVALLPAIVSRICRVSPDVPSFPYDILIYEAPRNKVMIHPVPSHTSIAIIADGFPANHTKLTLDVEVENMEGPEVIFTAMLVSYNSASNASLAQLPPVNFAEAKTQLGPKDGIRQLALALAGPRAEPLSILLATDAVEHVSFAWAKFSNFRVSP